jgi:hypothetical protein
MNAAIWTIQIVLVLNFAFVGILKLAVPREKLLATGQRNMAWAEDFSPAGIRLIGLLEIFGALGLLLPAWSGILPGLTPVAAIGLMIIMTGAVVVHLRRQEGKLALGPASPAILACAVAVGRIVLVPL